MSTIRFRTRADRDEPGKPNEADRTETCCFLIRSQTHEASRRVIKRRHRSTGMLPNALDTSGKLVLVEFTGGPSLSNSTIFAGFYFCVPGVSANYLPANQKPLYQLIFITCGDGWGRKETGFAAAAALLPSRRHVAAPTCFGSRLV